MRAERGFTLLEVLVALVVVSVALAAVIRAGTQQSQAQGTLKQLSLATWVAGNVIEQTRIDGGPLRPSRRQGRNLMGHEDFFWEMEISATDIAGIARLDVAVYADAGRRHRVTELTGFAPAQ